MQTLLGHPSVSLTVGSGVAFLDYNEKTVKDYW